MTRAVWVLVVAVALVAGASADACSAKDCGSCVGDGKQGCGWCAATNTCGAHNSTTPMACSGNVETLFCTGAPCTSYNTCEECVMDPFCGFCHSNNRCYEGNGRGPLVNLDCNAGALWNYGQCKGGVQIALPPATDMDQLEAVPADSSDDKWGDGATINPETKTELEEDANRRRAAKSDSDSESDDNDSDSDSDSDSSDDDSGDDSDNDSSDDNDSDSSDDSDSDNNDGNGDDDNGDDNTNGTEEDRSSSKRLKKHKEHKKGTNEKKHREAAAAANIHKVLRGSDQQAGGMFPAKASKHARAALQMALDGSEWKDIHGEKLVSLNNPSLNDMAEEAALMED